MRNLFLVSIAFTVFQLCLATSAQAQLKHAAKPQFAFTEKGQMYIHWGYNRAAFTKSDIHFEGPGYGMTLYKVRANDRPSAGLNSYVNLAVLTTPQFNLRAGVFITPRLAVSFGYDHMKYVLQPDQEVLVTGSVSELASVKYAGAYDRTPTVLTRDFVQYEHTDGLNYFSVDIEYHQPIWGLPSGNLGLQAVGSLQAGFVVSRTEAYVFNKGADTRYHLSGVGGSAQLGLRAYFLKHFFLTAACKAGCINQYNVITDNTLNSKAQHHFGFVEGIVAGGGQFVLFGKKPPRK
jgi:hypothetical protein